MPSEVILTEEDLDIIAEALSARCAQYNTIMDRALRTQGKESASYKKAYRLYRRADGLCLRMSAALDATRRR